MITAVTVLFTGLYFLWPYFTVIALFLPYSHHLLTSSHRLVPIHGKEGTMAVRGARADIVAVTDNNTKTARHGDEHL